MKGHEIRTWCGCRYHQNKAGSNVEKFRIYIPRTIKTQARIVKKSSSLIKCSCQRWFTQCVPKITKVLQHSHSSRVHLSLQSLKINPLNTATLFLLVSYCLFLFFFYPFPSSFYLFFSVCLFSFLCFSFYLSSFSILCSLNITPSTNNQRSS